MKGSRFSEKKCIEGHKGGEAKMTSVEPISMCCKSTSESKGIHGFTRQGGGEKEWELKGE